MRILAVSDQVEPSLYEHFDPRRWQDVDLIVSCGDLPPGYLDFLATTLRRPLLYVRGNHDGRYEADEFAGFWNLEAAPWQEMGLTIAGFEGSPRYNGGPVQYSEREMGRRVRRRLGKLGTVDLLVTHAPPRGCGDRPDLCHQGFESLRSAVLNKQPRFLLHGHSHLYSPCGRYSRLGGTMTINAFGHCLLSLDDAISACA